MRNIYSALTKLNTGAEVVSSVQYIQCVRFSFLNGPWQHMMCSVMWCFFLRSDGFFPFSTKCLFSLFVPTSSCLSLKLMALYLERVQSTQWVFQSWQHTRPLTHRFYDFASSHRHFPSPSQEPQLLQIYHILILTLIPNWPQSSLQTKSWSSKYPLTLWGPAKCPHYRSMFSNYDLTSIA